MLGKQLENHNKKALRKTIANLELESTQFKLIVQMLYEKSTYLSMVNS
jgi:hypothetical protein